MWFVEYGKSKLVVSSSHKSIQWTFMVLHNDRITQKHIILQWVDGYRKSFHIQTQALMYLVHR